MRYLITGYKGQLGYDIVRELKKRNENDIISLDVDDMDITNKDTVDTVITKYNPDVIMHCAAYTNVDGAEDNEELCYKVNVIGTKNIVEVAKKIDAKMLYISTDYIFDGNKEGLYEINDKANPLSVYGKTKYEGELETLKHDKSFIVRISWVFGINGKNFIRTMLRLAETRNEINVVCDQIGSPTYTVDLSKLLVDIVNTDKYGIYHANNSGYCSWADFAKYIFEINSINVKVNPIKAADYPSKAIRPYNSKLSKQSLIDNGFELLPAWEDAVLRYNEELNNEKQLVKKLGE